MKHRLLFILSIALLLSSCSKNVLYENIGTPQKDSHADNISARCPKDIIFHDGSLYIGGGDYDKNSGPVNIWRYSEDEEEWSRDATLPDEEISRFTVLSDGRLAAPGIDPRDDWSLGNYYVKSSDGWQNIRDIPGGIHTFDLAEYGSSLFAGCGVGSGHFPVLEKRGKEWHEIRFVRDGKTVKTDSFTFIRTYELFIFGGELYATLFLSNELDTTSYELYKYDTECFVYCSEFSSKLSGIKLSSFLISDSAVYEDRLFLATGHLYVTENMTDYKKITVGYSGTAVYDIMISDGAVHILCGKKTGDEKYRISVWKNSADEPETFREMIHFEYMLPALSFAASEEYFYFAMGEKEYEKDDLLCGSILKVKR